MRRASRQTGFVEGTVAEGNTSRTFIRRAFHKFQEAYGRLENPSGKNP